ncbi:hypothetical protein CR513_22592, partial [Mucuna pruriens]
MMVTMKRKCVILIITQSVIQALICFFVEGLGLGTYFPLAYKALCYGEPCIAMLHEYAQASTLLKI